MKHFTWLLIATFALTMAACGGKKDDENNKGGKGKTPSGDKADKGGAAIDEARAAELGAVDVPGFKRHEKAGPGMKTVAMSTYEQEAANANSRKAFVMVNAQKCMMCQPMDVDKWKANENLKMMLSKAHKENPNLVWEVGTLEAGGKTAITVYSRSFVQMNEGKTTLTANGIDVHYNNGTNQLVMQISVRGGPPAKSEEELETLYTKDEMLAVAKTFVETFAPKL